MTFRLGIVLLLIGSAGCDGARVPRSADAGPICESPVACCRAGDAAACGEAAAERGPDERRDLLEKGCELGDAKLCLRAAAAQMGDDAAKVDKLAARGCSIQPAAWIPGAHGEELSCQFFDHDIAERAERLATACRAREKDSCRRLGDLLRPYDARATERAYATDCAMGGLHGTHLASCVAFLDMLASPPTCPKEPRTSLPSYGACPSEAKRLPAHPGRVRVRTSKDRASKGFGEAAQGSRDFALCHTAGLVTDPALEGRVRLAAIVDSAGRPRNVSTAGSTLDDALALECFRRQTAGLRVATPPTTPLEVRVDIDVTP